MKSPSTTPYTRCSSRTHCGLGSMWPTLRNARSPSVNSTSQCSFIEYPRRATRSRRGVEVEDALRAADRVRLHPRTLAKTAVQQPDYRSLPHPFDDGDAAVRLVEPEDRMVGKLEPPGDPRADHATMGDHYGAVVRSADGIERRGARAQVAVALAARERTAVGVVIQAL